jgi:hypothetical protein
VHCSATDAAGNISHASFVVKVLAPKQVLRSVQTVVHQLIAVSDPKTAKRLVRADEALSTAQRSAFWRGPGRLDPKRGDEVFAALKTAVKRLLQSADPRAVTQANRVTTTADVLTAAAIAQAANGDPKQLQRANTELANARAEARAGRAEAALEHYRKAWRHAQKALDEH